MRPSLVRPTWLATHRSSLLLASAIVTSASYAVWLASLRPEPRTVPVTIPIAVTIPVAAPPVIAAPATVDTAPATESPDLVGSCLIQERLAELATAVACSDRGFPAISADGRTIAALFSDGEARVKLRFVSVATSRVVDEIELASEHDAVDAQLRPTTHTRTAIRERAAEEQAKLDAGRFRSLVSIPQVDAGSEHVDSVSMLYDADEDDSAMTVLDEAADRELWSARFTATGSGFPAGPADGPTCHPSKTRSIATWWDARTQTIVAEATFVGWACDCPTWGVHHAVHRAAR